MERLRSSAAVSRCWRILRFIQDRYPHSVAGLESGVALDRIRSGLRWIQAAGVRDGQAAALFVVTQFAAGPTFYLHPSCQALLTNRRLPPDARVMSMFCADATIPWDDIAARRDDSAWPRFRDEAAPNRTPATHGLG